MPDPARQRAFALEIVQKLRAAGFEALWAGGCVRDELLGLVPKDYDVATSATPDQIRDLFGRRRTLADRRGVRRRDRARPAGGRANRSRHLSHRRRLQRRPAPR